MKILFLSLMLAASIAQAVLADQLLYDADSGKQIILLKNDGSLWLNTPGEGWGLWGYLEGSIIYHRTQTHTIGYRMGNVLYGNNGHVFGYFKLGVGAGSP
jgi:hypothetical protein